MTGKLAARKYDYETRAYYFRARYYDPQVGRFLSEDPIRFEGKQTSFYPYVHNSPPNYLDPNGLKPWDKAKAFNDCLDGCLKTMMRPDFCTMKKNLISLL